MKYLGLPVSDKRLSKAELSGSAVKVEKRLDVGLIGSRAY